MSSISALKSNAIQSATYDTILQVCLRLVSFFLNAFIVRCVSSSVFAVMSVRLHLLYSTGLLLSREAFRRAALGCKSPGHIQKVVNLIWMGTGISIPLSALGWLLWCWVMDTPPRDVTMDYHSGVCLILLSVVIEVASDPPYIMAELHMWAKVKVAIEGSMQLGRVFLLSAGLMVWPSRAILVYGISHVIGSLLYCFSYYALFAREFRRKEAKRKLLFGSFRGLFIKFPEKGYIPEVDAELGRVALSFLKQGWIKEVLTEGEFFLMNFFPLVSLDQQGVYQIVNNLGSLAARLVFRSIEAAAYKFFVQTIVRGKPVKQQDKKKMKEVSEFLSTLLRNLMLISLVIVTFGWAFSHPLLQLYGGANLSSSGRDILRFQCFYVVFMALNGITEAFTFAAMSDQQLASHNYSLIGFSLIYVCVTVVSVKFFGVFGFIIGNCTNMLLRIIHSFWFIREFFAGSEFNPLSSLKISWRVGISFFSAFVVTGFSEVSVYPWSFWGHVVTGLLSGLIVIVVLKEELQDILINVFDLSDKIYSKFFPRRNKDREYNCYLLNVLYRFLYS